MPATARKSTAKSSEFEVVSLGATRILQAAVRENVSLQELGQLAGADPAFAARLLATVNSAAYRGSNAVSDLTRAITLLGIRGTRAIALGLVVSDLAPSDPNGDVLLANCIRRANAARSLALAMGASNGDDEFTAGLLLDSGLLVKQGGSFAEAAEIGRSPAHERVFREHALRRKHHPELGFRLAAALGLPEAVVNAIRSHHDPDVPKERLAAVAWVAERVAGVFEGGAPALTRPMAIEAGFKLGLNEEQVDKILHELPVQVGETAAAFNRDLGPQLPLEELINGAREALGTMARQYGELVQALSRAVEEKAQLAEQLRLANVALAEQATTDALTGLPNRRAFDDAFVREIARSERHRKPLTLAVLDVDHFKQFNDTYGHATGDEVLKTVGATLMRTLRTTDLGARFGGEEFAVILPETDLSGALVAAERIRRAIGDSSIDVPQGKVGVTVSIGTVTYNPHRGSATPAKLFEMADKALYCAKQQGRNRVVGA